MDPDRQGGWCHTRGMCPVCFLGKRSFFVSVLQEMWENPHVKKVLDLSERAKLQAATDFLEAVYFLHSHREVRFSKL